MTSFHFFTIAPNRGIDDGESDASADLSQVAPAKWQPSANKLRGRIGEKQRPVFMLKSGNRGLPLGR